MHCMSSLYLVEELRKERQKLSELPAIPSGQSRQAVCKRSCLEKCREIYYTV